MTQDNTKRVEELEENIRKNFSSLKYKVCTRDMTLDDMLEYIMPQLQSLIQQTREEISNKCYEAVRTHYEEMYNVKSDPDYLEGVYAAKDIVENILQSLNNTK